MLATLKPRLPCQRGRNHPCPAAEKDSAELELGEK